MPGPHKPARLFRCFNSSLEIIRLVVMMHVRFTTDGLRSFGDAMDEFGNRDKQEIGRWANIRVGNCHLPFQRRERAMLRFRQLKALQKFASVHASLHNHFATERHPVDRQTFRQTRSAALAE